MPISPQAPLIPAQIEAVFQNVSLLALGLITGINPPALVDPAAYSKVRIGWQVQGQPSQSISDNVAYVRAVEEDDPYNQIRDEMDLVNDSTTIQQVTAYTRVWRIFWTVYGPNSFDNVRIIKSALHRPSQPIGDLLATRQLHFVPPGSTPRRMPYEFSGQWWERTDFDALFNEGVVEAEVVGTAASVEVITETADGVISDQVYTKP